MKKNQNKLGKSLSDTPGLQIVQSKKEKEE